MGSGGRAAFAGGFVKEEPWRGEGSPLLWDPARLGVLPGAERQPDGRDAALGPLPAGWQQEQQAKDRAGNGSKLVKGPLSCQVEGCGKDLTLEKGYYQRYRVCEPHLKLLSLMVDGKPSRFCQQCGRFHELSAFDGSKRSCRARLLQHNARRRKREPLDTSKHEPSSGGRKSKGASGSGDPASDCSQEASHHFSPGHSQDLSSAQGDKVSTANLALDVEPDQCLVPGPASREAPSGMRVTEASSGGLGGPAGMTGWQPGPVARSAVSGTVPMLAGAGAAQPVRCAGGLSAAAGRLSDSPAEAPSLPPRCLPPSAELVGSGSSSAYAFCGLPRELLQPPHQQQNMRFASHGPSLLDSTMGDATRGGQMASCLDTSMDLGGLPLDDVMLDSLLAMDADDLLSGSFGRAPSSMDRPAASTSSFRLGSGALPYNNSSVGSPSPACTSDALPTGVPMDMGGAPMFLPAPGFALQTQQHYFQQSSLGPPVGGPGPGVALNKRAMQQHERELAQWNSSLYTIGSSQSGGLSMGGPSAPASGVSSVAMSAISVPSLAAAPAGVPPQWAPPALPAQPNPRTAMSSFELARKLVAGGGHAAQYQSDEMMVRVSIKIANCTPDQLPPDLHQRLSTLLATADASLVQGFLRPGCTHLVLDALHATGGACAGPTPGGDGEEAAGLGLGLTAASVCRALASAASLAGCGPVLIQLPHEAALFETAAAPMAAEWCQLEELAGGPAPLPEIAHASLVSRLDASGGATLLVYGRGLCSDGARMFARIQGGYVPLETEAVDVGEGTRPGRVLAALRARGLPADEALCVRVSGAPGSGLLLLEAQAGVLLSNCRPCVLLEDGPMAAELQALEAAALAGRTSMACVEAFAADFGRLIDQRSYAPAGAGAEEPPPAMEVVCACEKLLGYSSDAGLAATSVFLVRALLQYEQQLQQVLCAPYADGLSVLHRAVRSGSPALVAALQGLAAGEERAALQWGAVDAAVGLSPLHVAACMPRMWHVLQAVPGVAHAWSEVKARGDGATASQVQGYLLQAARGARAAQPQQQQPKQHHQHHQQQQGCKHTPAAAAHTATAGEAQAAAAVAGPAPPQASQQRAAGSGRWLLLPDVLLLPALLFAVSLLCLLTAVQMPVMPMLVLAAGVAYTVHALLQLSSAAHGAAFRATMASLLLPAFEPSLELAYKHERGTALAQRDVAGSAAVLLVCCLAVPVPVPVPAASSSSGLAHNAAAAVNVSLVLLPMLLLQLSKPLYVRSRSLLLIAPYCALLSAACSLSQQLLVVLDYGGGPVRCCCAMVYAALLVLAGCLLPVKTQSMLLLGLISVANMLRAWARLPGVVTGMAAVEAAERCSMVQVGMVATAAMVTYARDLVWRRDFVVARALLGQQEGKQRQQQKLQQRDSSSSSGDAREAGAQQHACSRKHAGPGCACSVRAAAHT